MPWLKFNVLHVFVFPCRVEHFRYDAPMAELTPVPIKKRTTAAFEEGYSRLNSAQKEAVDRIEGPVMVVAGPGTGKTQVLSLRVANILKRTQARPSNILCLTFSTSGAKAMRERLRTVIGPDAYGVHVNTVHSFCNDIIQQHPQLFIEFRALEQVSQIERLRAVRKSFADMPPDAVLSRPVGDSDRAGDVLSRISEMKREGISVERIRELLPLYQEEIRFTPTGRERDTESKSYKDDLRKVQQMEEFAMLYDRYNKELHESHRYDFDDMVLVVLQALRENDWLLAQLQERYHYVLVDEFQDLNGAQNQVIDLLTQYVHTDQAPNVFVVGDDDQAIYRFQGANIGNMRSFLERFADCAVITLTTSYRCPQPVLDVAGTVIAQNQERLVHVLPDISKDLRAAEKSKDSKKPMFLRYPDTGTQFAGIADILKKTHNDNVAWKEIAVICRRNEEVLELADVLSSAGIPCEVAAKQDLLSHPQVREAIVLLRTALDIHSSSNLAAALSLSCFAIHPADRGKLFLTYRQLQYEQDAPLSLHAYILEHQDQCAEGVCRAHELLMKLHQEQDACTLPALLQELLIKSGLLPPQSADSADPRAIAGIHAFFDYVKNRCYEQKNLDLRLLLADIDVYLAEPSLKLEYDLPHLVMDGVQLLTAHGSKGLEFHTVVLPNLWYGNWGNRRGGSALSLPDHLLYDVDREIEKRASQEDERRLFYVAVTRAKNYLHLSFPEQYRSGEQMRDAQVSTFVAEAGQAVEEKILPTEELLPPIETLFQKDIVVDDAFSAFLKERLQDFALSVTALNTFLDGPEGPHRFLWEQLLGQPRAKPAHLSYGTAVHGALEDRNIAWKEGREFSSEELIQSFEKFMHQREIFTKEERERYMHIGRIVLERYAAITSQKPAIVLSAERSFLAHYDHIPLKGKVDRIDLFEPTSAVCRIVDFKTGTPLKTEEAVRKDEKYFRQLVFYKILCDLDQKFAYDAEVFSFDFVGNDREERRVIDLQITQQEVQELKELIRKVWAKITALDFSPLEGEL